MVHICRTAPDPRSSLLSLSNIGLVSSTWLYQDLSVSYWLVFRTTSPKRIATLSIIIASCSALLRCTHREHRSMNDRNRLPDGLRLKNQGPLPPRIDRSGRGSLRSKAMLRPGEPPCPHIGGVFCCGGRD